MAEMESRWQMIGTFSAVDGCHIPIKSPAGGRRSDKEYHNFKNFYSIILMAMVDAKGRFIWGSAGYPGNSRDAIVFESTKLYSHIVSGEAIPQISVKVGNVNAPPLVIGDSAFPLTTWLTKPYTCKTLTPPQRYFNYRLSRARMVEECTFGVYEGRWRILHKKCESSKESVKKFTLACMMLLYIISAKSRVSQ